VNIEERKVDMKNIFEDEFKELNPFISFIFLFIILILFFKNKFNI
jgi:hypothetical protein